MKGKAQLLEKILSCNSTVLFASSGPATTALYTGSKMHAQGIARPVLQQFIDQAHNKGIPNSIMVRLCGADDRGVGHELGIIENANGSLPFVQRVVKTRSGGKCVTGYDGVSTWKTATFWTLTPPLRSNANWVNSTSNSTSMSVV